MWGWFSQEPPACIHVFWSGLDFRHPGMKLLYLSLCSSNRNAFILWRIILKECPLIPQPGSPSHLREPSPVLSLSPSLQFPMGFDSWRSLLPSPWGHTWTRSPCNTQRAVAWQEAASVDLISGRWWGRREENGVLEVWRSCTEKGLITSTMGWSKKEVLPLDRSYWTSCSEVDWSIEKQF